MEKALIRELDMLWKNPQLRGRADIGNRICHMNDDLLMYKRKNSGFHKLLMSTQVPLAPLAAGGQQPKKQQGRGTYVKRTPATSY